MKGQMQFGESLMVIIVLIFILVIGMVFYFNVTKSGIEDEIRQREDVDAIVLAENALNLPELQCGRLAAKGDCIDKAKLEALAEILQTQGPAWDYYSLLFGYSTIKVHSITLDGMVIPTDTGLVLYDDKPDFEVLFQTPQYLFTTLYDPSTGSVDLAYLNVTRYTQKVSS